MRIGQIGSWLQRRTRKMGDLPPAPHPGGGDLPRPRGRSFSGLGSYDGQHGVDGERTGSRLKLQPAKGVFWKGIDPSARNKSAGLPTGTRAASMQPQHHR